MRSLSEADRVAPAIWQEFRYRYVDCLGTFRSAELPDAPHVEMIWRFIHAAFDCLDEFQNRSPSRKFYRGRKSFRLSSLLTQTTLVLFLKRCSNVIFQAPMTLARNLVLAWPELCDYSYRLSNGYLLCSDYSWEYPVCGLVFLPSGGNATRRRARFFGCQDTGEVSITSIEIMDSQIARTANNRG